MRKPWKGKYFVGQWVMVSDRTWGDCRHGYVVTQLLEMISENPNFKDSDYPIQRWRTSYGDYTVFDLEDTPKVAKHEAMQILEKIKELEAKQKEVENATQIENAE